MARFPWASAFGERGLDRAHPDAIDVEVPVGH
jgi:hypothetical protein